MSHTPNLRGLRARWCLSQEELAGLLGISQARISRYERNEETPALGTALALQVVFNEQPKRLFRALYEFVEDGVMQRGAELERLLDGKDDYASKKKRHLLEAMVARATSHVDA